MTLLEFLVLRDLLLLIVCVLCLLGGTAFLTAAVVMRDE